MTPERFWSGVPVKYDEISEESPSFKRTFDFVLRQMESQNFQYVSTDSVKVIHVPYGGGMILDTSKDMIDKICSVLNRSGFNAICNEDVGFSYCGHGPFIGVAIFKNESELQECKTRTENRRAEYKAKKALDEAPKPFEHKPEVKSWLQKMDEKYPWIKKASGGLFKPIGI